MLLHHTPPHHLRHPLLRVVHDHRQLVRGLPVPTGHGEVADDPLDVLLEPDGEHLVRLVENAVFDVVEVERAALDEIDEPARGADDDVDAAAKRALLVGDGDASVDAEGAE